MSELRRSRGFGNPSESFEHELGPDMKSRVYYHPKFWLLERTNIWELHGQGAWIAITTNGTIKKNGDAVMGRGVARQTVVRYPEIRRQLGLRIREFGNKPFIFYYQRLITFPVKQNWFDQKADLDLIRQSAMAVKELATSATVLRVYVPKPGCGNGNLDWSEVYPAIVDVLTPPQFIFVEYGNEPRK